MTFIEKFETIKKKMKNIESDALKEEFAIQVTMTDEDCGGIFYIANINSSFAVEPYNYYDNTLSVVCTSKTFVSIILGKISVSDAVKSGILEIYGNEKHAEILSVLVKKPKKRTVKKADGKTAAQPKKSVSAEKKSKTVSKKEVKKEN